ncbi:MAG: YdbH domain-containing protein [Hyphomonadaceae bacterium]|nr:YdbH domain-containing protein [Hyphomonadaceae bacterium]
MIFAAGLWFLRIPIAESLVKAELADRGVASDFRIVRLDFTGADIAAIRLGPETSPDVTIGAASLNLGWNWFTPELSGVRLVEPLMRVRLDPVGHVSLGSVDGALRGGAPSTRRPSLPGIRLDVEDGQALIDGPFGVITASFNAAGVLGRDFSALAEIAPVSCAKAGYALDNAAAALRIETENGGLLARLLAQADGMAWEGTEFNGLALDLEGRAPLDLGQASLRGVWRVAGARMPQQLAADALTGSITLESTMQDDALIPARWQGDARFEAGRLAAARDELLGVRGNANVVTENGEGRGEWALAAARVDGFGLVAPDASASGQLSFDLDAVVRAELHGVAALRGAALSANAQQTLRGIVPNLPGSPVGPAFEQAESTLDAAVDRFDLNLPISFEVAEHTARLLVPGSIDLRATTGTRVNIAPIRDGEPALVLQFPGPSLGGGVALDMSGGGAPRLTLLLDTMDWSTGQPFETEGTLTVHDWRAGSSSISTDELIVRFSMKPEGGGQLDLVGPARITGPVGDGQVRDLIPQLDVAIAWGEGWRITPNGCLPVGLGQLDVAGLSFAGGAFSLCASAGGPLIASNSSGAMSGGFSIARLELNGALSGPNPPPARLRAANVVGRFAGVTEDMQVLVTATSPALAVDLAEERTMLVQGEELTANAVVGGGTWRVDGAFHAGTFEEPSMPGSVSAIAGRWSAAPENDTVVLRVEAGEAFMQARAAPDDAEDTRPLFNPVRLTQVEALMRDGRVTANGHVVLDAGARALAGFNAVHNLESGEGEAHVIADDLVFSENLQPYEISELARGLIENVRGAVDASGDARWSRETFSLTGTVRPNGVSLAMSTIPVIENVRGEVFFDDLVNLTTPPGQVLEIGALNPGVEVRNGRVAFQLLPEQNVAIESATFEFAGGELALAPTTIALGAEETRFNLTLSDVDVASLITQLNMPDIQATGRVEGTFPIRLTPRTAFIEGGQLRAAPGGGTIAYVGNAGEGVTGAARVAFDALRSFRYDDLTLDLNGDLNGEVVSQINFSGQNTGQPVDLTPIAGTPIGAVNARGVPFAFRVSVSAPFRQLARTAAGIVNPGDILNDAQNGDSEPTDENSPTSTPPSVDVQVQPLN